MTIPQILVRFVPTWEPEIEIPKLPEWIEWSGGERPVSGRTWVEVKLRGVERTIENDARLLGWSSCNDKYDIIAYRVIR